MRTRGHIAQQNALQSAFVWVRLALLATVVVMAGCGRGGGPKGPAAAEAEAGGTQTPVTVVTAQRGSIMEELELTGTCDADEEVDVVPEVSGKVVAVYADIGDLVQKGDLLLRLDTSLVEKQRVQAERSLDAAHAQLTQASESARLTDKQTEIGIRQAEQGVAAARENLRKAEEAYKLTQAQVRSQIEQARVGLASAQEQQREVMAGARNQEVALAEASVRQAEADLSLKKSDYERYSRLRQQGAVAAATLDQYQTAYNVAQQTLSRAKEQLSLVREGARQEQKRLAQLSVQQAEERVTLAEAGRRQADIAARDVEAARVGLRQAEEQVRMARASRKQYDVSVAGVRAARAGIGQAAAGRDLLATTQGKYAVYAPISGRIARRNVDMGEGASPGFAVMRIVADNPIRVNCTVSELDVANVKVGDQGLVMVDGLPGTEFFGLVTVVSPQVREEQRNYTARIEIDNPDGLIRAGMFARVVLVLAEKHDVVVVSRDCLVERGKTRRAYLVENGEIKIRNVKIGVVNRDRVEIVKGVEGGAQVVAGGQSILAAGQKVKPVLRAEKESAAGSPTAAPSRASESTAKAPSTPAKRSAAPAAKAPAKPAARSAGKKTPEAAESPAPGRKPSREPGKWPSAAPREGGREGSQAGASEGQRRRGPGGSGEGRRGSGQRPADRQ